MIQPSLEATVPLSEHQLQRYRRSILLKGIGVTGQEKLLSARVLIVGTGGLGSPAALYLAAAGVGTIGLLDGDDVDLTNLQRQLLHHTGDLGRRKVVSAREKIEALNPDVTIQTHDAWARADNIAEIVRGYDFVLDCVDNFGAKFLINDACYFQAIPYCHGGILEFEGQLMTIAPGQTACYRCVFPSAPPAETIAPAGQAGVLGVLPGVIGTLQATEAIKFILDIGDLLTDTLLTYSALTTEFRKVRLSRDASCPLCSDDASITQLASEAT